MPSLTAGKCYSLGRITSGQAAAVTTAAVIVVASGSAGITISNACASDDAADVAQARPLLQSEAGQLALSTIRRLPLPAMGSR